MEEGRVRSSGWRKADRIRWVSGVRDEAVKKAESAGELMTKDDDRQPRKPYFYRRCSAGEGDDPK